MSFHSMSARNRLPGSYLGPSALDGLRWMGHPATMWENEFVDATVLTESECFQHLSQVSLGRIAVSIDALPVILPVRFVLSNDSVIFPTVAGSKFDAATAGTVIAFQADEQDPFSGNYWSVLLQGIASSAGDSPGDVLNGAFPLESRPDLQRKLNMVRIESTIVSGRRFRVAGEGPSIEPPDAPRL